MKPVLLINPNSSEQTTEAMVAIALRHLPAVRGWTNVEAPLMITDQVALNAAADQISSATLPEASAVIIAAFGDPAAEVLAARMDVPVVGMGAAAARAAGQDGVAFAVVTTTPKLVPAIDVLMRAKGGKTYQGCFLTKGDPVALAGNPDALDDALADACTTAAEAGAQRVIIGGGPLAKAAIRIAPRLAVQLVHPIAAACVEISEI